MQKLDVDVVLGGGIFRTDDDTFLRRIRDGVREIAPAARVAVLTDPPVVGAAWLGLDRLGAPEAVVRPRAPCLDPRSPRHSHSPSTEGAPLMADIVLDRVSKVFGSDVVAVNDVSLEIGDGEFMVLVGPSGCGKSTILRILAGLEEVTAGEIWIGGTQVTDLPPKDRDIAMVFQNYALYPHMTVEQNLGFGLRLRKTSKEEQRVRVAEAARILGLIPLMARKPSELSGGQRQRVAMGRAMVREPRAFLMDEPLSNLDAKLRVQMRAELSRLHERLGTTTIYVTHDQVEAMTLGQRVSRPEGRCAAAGRHSAEPLQPSGQPLRGRVHRVAAHEPGGGRRDRVRHLVRRVHAAAPGSSPAP